MKQQHIMMMSLVVVIHLRECAGTKYFCPHPTGNEAPVWDWMADAASDMQLNWFNGRPFETTARRERHYTGSVPHL